MRDLLLDYQRCQGAANKEVYDVQEPFPLELSVQVVQEQQCEHLSVVSECVQLQLKMSCREERL